MTMPPVADSGPIDFVAWRRASYCTNSGCVEVAFVGNGRIAVRSSKEQDRQVLFFDSEEWQTFLAGVKAGEFDESLNEFS